jgi:hypothetical protein
MRISKVGILLTRFGKLLFELRRFKYVYCLAVTTEFHTLHIENIFYNFFKEKQPLTE